MARTGGAGGFAVSVALEAPTARSASAPASERDATDGAPRRGAAASTAPPVGSAAAFAEHAAHRLADARLDGLFTGPAGDRRRFLDRLVLAVDAGHGARVSASNARCARATACSRTSGPIPPGSTPWSARSPRPASPSPPPGARPSSGSPPSSRPSGDDASPFPWAERVADRRRSTTSSRTPPGRRRRGPLPRPAARGPRPRDRAAGRTLVGPQTSDLAVRHGPKDIARRAGLDRRAEGAAGRPRAGPCPPGRRDDRHRPARAARRGRRPSRSAPPRRPVRRARRAGRAGLDDRRRSRRVFADLPARRPRCFEVTPGACRGYTSAHDAFRPPRLLGGLRARRGLARARHRRRRRARARPRP